MALLRLFFFLLLGVHGLRKRHRSPTGALMEEEKMAEELVHEAEAKLDFQEPKANSVANATANATSKAQEPRGKVEPKVEAKSEDTDSDDIEDLEDENSTKATGQEKSGCAAVPMAAASLLLLLA